MSKLQHIHTFKKYDIYIYTNICITLPTYQRYPVTMGHQHQELLPSWSRPWARLGMAAEGMEDGLGIWAPLAMKNP